MDKNNTELDDIDREMLADIDPDYKEPGKSMRFYAEKHKLWEMRFGYQADNDLSFEENLICYSRYKYEKGLILKILDIKTTFFYETGRILCE
jgi:hypothetical protein